MSIFGKIMSAIFGGSSAQAAPAAGATPTAAPGATPSAAAEPAQRVDVEAVVAGYAANKKEKLDWRRSIVDLMKVLDLDSSLAARKELAQELGYKGKLDGSAEMNIWLHKQVMLKLEQSGGKVPADMKD
ncbi:MAG: DUF3597 domain-containing protein [Xanthobacteraceae bacterium]|nr:DUF3597 domain-containing protein [Xanthobacteraceae bacterium]PWB64505.1 MAG: hypothetical protein C3F17_06955 [Bradyrhizobiaceae bacterium]